MFGAVDKGVKTAPPVEAPIVNAVIEQSQASTPLSHREQNQNDESALIVDGSDAVAIDEPAQPPEAAAAKKLPSSIILDENGADIAATPSPEDVEDRIDEFFGKSDPSAPKEPLVIDEDDVSATLVSTGSTHRNDRPVAEQGRSPATLNRETEESAGKSVVGAAFDRLNASQRPPGG